MKYLTRKKHYPVGLLAAIIIVLLTLLSPNDSSSQIRSGAAFLKMLPGSKQQSMANSLTGATDEFQSFYANPAATGFARLSYLSGSYTKWFADVYNVSVNYGRRITTPISSRANFALGINYLGVREFDSTLRHRESATAYDVLLTSSFGVPVSFISKNLSVGSNAKYLHSELSNYTAGSFIFDFGALYRTNRFNVLENLFEYGFVSFGAAITQIGKPLNFITYETPLPQTYRLGAALNLGSHNGLQMQLTADYRKVKDEAGRFGMGTEISWGYNFSLRTGYNFDDNMLSKLSMGLSVRFNGQSNLVNKVVANNNALRLDIAGLEGNELFDASYRGTINNYPIGPEPFDLILPVLNDTLQNNNLTFFWEMSIDPDLYDDVAYYLLVEKNDVKNDKKTRLHQILTDSEKGKVDIFQSIAENRLNLFYAKDSTFTIEKEIEQVSHHLRHLTPGDYYWTVLAFDRDKHYLAATSRINHFHILYPDIEIDSIKFQHSPWITESDTQGVFEITISNNGDFGAEKILTTVISTPLFADKNSSAPDTIYQDIIPNIPERSTKILRMTWLSTGQGQYKIDAHARIIKSKTSFGKEINLANNRNQAAFYTIPKGSVTTHDTLIAYITPKTDHNLPFVSRVFFDEQSCSVRTSYFKKSERIFAPLKLLAERLERRPDLIIKLEGIADSAAGETLELARKRVQAVRTILLELGVPDVQIPLTGMKWSFSNHRRKTSNQDVKEERRFVKISAHDVNDDSEDLSIFLSIPVKTIQKEAVPLPVEFASSLRGFIPIKFGHLFINSATLSDSVDIEYTGNSIDTLIWRHSMLNQIEWMQKTGIYHIGLVDTLNRFFRTRAKLTYLDNLNTHLPLTVGLAEFNNLKPYPIETWEELFTQLKLRLKYDKNVHIRFVGHACGIPPNTVNNKYSNIRAQNFQDLFLREVSKYKNKDSELYNLVKNRLDAHGTIGRGSLKPFSCTINYEKLLMDRANFDSRSRNQIEKIFKTPTNASSRLEPFNFEKTDNKIKLIGDNKTPEGRQINRRIEIQLFYPQTKIHAELSSSPN
ncbi:hypothetical protein B6I21_00115 [candidate division KSB1 bacterium 4572_119]|nr:MAG: hypothetical protein B6I21_00115 [candidate division KSB1 bacterium 4572_119]